MMTRLFILSGVIFAFHYITENSAQFWKQPKGFSHSRHHPQHYYPNYYQPKQYQQQNGFQNNIQLPPGVSMSEVEWICRNPKTDYMMIIASGEGQTSDIESIDQNNLQSINMSTTQQPPSSEPLNLELTDSYNTDGEGVIDIRLGNKQANKDSNK